MAQRTSGIWSILTHPTVYRLVQHIFGATDLHRNLEEDFIRARPGDRVLDIGCGPAHMLNFLPDVMYVGYDPNPYYIETAQRSFRGRRAEFHAGLFTEADLARHQPFDIGLLLGVLHHLDDADASHLLGLLRKGLKPGGRLVTFDNVFIDNQNPIARKLIEWDRGKNVRTANGYRSLVKSHFDTVRDVVIHRAFPPYTLFQMECS